jgi:hypothetical protein
LISWLSKIIFSNGWVNSRRYNPEEVVDYIAKNIFKAGRVRVDSP